MGFREIAMIIVSLILGGILALNVAPSISASGDATKTSMLNGEFESINSAAKMWMSNNSTTGTFNGLTPTAMTNTIPNLTITALKFTSKVNSAVNYDVASATTTSTDDSALITINGLNTTTGAEAALKTSFTTKYGAAAITDTVTTDGILVVKVRG
jgi:hypothetical protein